MSSAHSRFNITSERTYTDTTTAHPMTGEAAKHSEKLAKEKQKAREQAQGQMEDALAAGLWERKVLTEAQLNQAVKRDQAGPSQKEIAAVERISAALEDVEDVSVVNGSYNTPKKP